MGAYDLDFHAWALAQADAARRRSANEIDWDNLAEELEALGSSKRVELKSRLVVLISHLLKWQFQPLFRSRSWMLTVKVQRKDLEDLLQENPSLRALQAGAFADAYVKARMTAASETGLALRDFPEAPPFTLEQAMAEDWLPGTL